MIFWFPKNVHILTFGRCAATPPTHDPLPMLFFEPISGPLKNPPYRPMGQIEGGFLKENDWRRNIRPNIIEQIWAAKNQNKKIRGAQNFVQSLKTIYS